MGPDRILVVPSLHSPGLKSRQHIRCGECRLLWSQLPSSCQVWGFPPPARAAGHTLKGQLLQAPYSRAGLGDMDPPGRGTALPDPLLSPRATGPSVRPWGSGHRGPTPTPLGGDRNKHITYPPRRSPTSPGRLELIQTGDVNQAPVLATGQDGMRGLAGAIRMSQSSDSLMDHFLWPPGGVASRKAWSGRK